MAIGGVANYTICCSVPDIKKWDDSRKYRDTKLETREKGFFPNALVQTWEHLYSLCTPSHFNSILGMKVAYFISEMFLDQTERKCRDLHCFD